MNFCYLMFFRRDTEMAHMRIILVGLLLVVCGGFIGGCRRPVKTTTDDDYTFVDPELRKLDLQRRLEKRYNDPDIHYELGKIYQSEGLWEKAIFHYKIAFSIDPVNWTSAAATVKAHYQAGRKTKAISMTEYYSAKANYSASSLLLLGRAFQNEMLDDEALACFHRALKIAPDSAELNKQIGYYYQGKNDLIRAEQYLRRSLEIKPSRDVSRALGTLGIPVELPRRRRVTPEEAPLEAPVEDSFK
jgi:tetratricopeptide (TPR) repeat protein